MSDSISFVTRVPLYDNGREPWQYVTGSTSDALGYHPTYSVDINDAVFYPSREIAVAWAKRMEPNDARLTTAETVGVKTEVVHTRVARVIPESELRVCFSTPS